MPDARDSGTTREDGSVMGLIEHDERTCDRCAAPTADWTVIDEAYICGECQAEIAAEDAEVEALRERAAVAVVGGSPCRWRGMTPQEPRRWSLLVCPCGTVAQAGAECAGFPGAWDEDRSDFDRGACLGEVVEVLEVIKA